MRRTSIVQLAGGIVATGLAVAFAFGLSQSADAGVRAQTNCYPNYAVYIPCPTTTLPTTPPTAPPTRPPVVTPGNVPPVIIPPILLPGNPVTPIVTTTAPPVVVGDTVKIVVTGASFGEVAVGTVSPPRDVTVSNQGNVPVPIKGAVTDPPFAIVAGAGSCAYTPSLNPGASCTYKVTFTPQGPSTFTGTFRVTLILPAANGVATGSLDGRGGAPRLEFDPPTVDLGPIPVGVKQPVVVTLRNTGTVAITIASIGPVKKTTEAIVAKKPCVGAVIPPSGSCQVSITFTGLAGKRTVTFTALGTKRETASLVVTRNGVKSGLTITPPAIDFGALAVGKTSGKKTFKVTNSGGLPLTLGAKTIAGAGAGDYQSPSNTCGAPVLAPKASCTIDVIVKPSAPGPRVAKLTVSATAGKVKLSATGGLLATPPGPTTTVKATIPPTVLTAPPTAPPVVKVVPTLRMDPAVGVAGQVTTAIGRGFPANTTVELAWAGFQGRMTVQTDASGSFRHPVLVQRGERIGGRTMQALAQPTFDTVRAPYLLQLPTFAPRSAAGSNRLVTRS